MMLKPLRFALRPVTIVAVVLLSVILPATASASTWTVGSGPSCPNATFTSIQAAINQAAPHDTIDICPGTYMESSTPTNNASSPAQTGSMDGLLIQKPLNIVGAGAGLVTIEPDPTKMSNLSLAGTAPYLRDGGGAVISITRQSLGNTDFTDNYVSISGVTVESPVDYAEAGIQFFNASGSVSNSVVGPLASAASTGGTTATRPYGWGILVTDSLQGAGTGTVMRNVTVSNTEVTGYQAGGIDFDDAYGADGTTGNTGRSGIIQYGYVEGSHIAGASSSAAAPQIGVEYHDGERGSVTNSEITGNSNTGLLLTDAQTATDPNNPPALGFYALGNNFTNNGYAIQNENASGTGIPTGVPAKASDGTAADENWFGCPTGPLVGAPSTDVGGSPGCEGISGLDTNSNPSVTISATPRAAAPTPLVMPPTTVDNPPTGQIADPLDGSTSPAGGTIHPLVQAADDFGVQSVKMTAHGVSLGTVTTPPYSFNWTPSYADIGSSVPLIATITDSSGQTTQSTINVTVTAPAGYQAATVSPTAFTAGTVLVGESASQIETVTNSGQNPITLGAIGTTGAGFSEAPTGTTGCAGSLTVAVGDSCTLRVTFAPTTSGAVTGGLTVPYTAPGAASPLTVPLSATGQFESVGVTGTVSGTVAPTLGLSVGTPSLSLGTFSAATTQDYLGSVSADVTSSAGSATLSAYDPSTASPGHLKNGTFSLPSALQMAATNSASLTASYGSLSASTSPLTLLTYPGPVSNDPVTLLFKQHIGATDALRSGNYSTTVVVTLSTSTP